jgi:predicted dienelactone hydrolase
MLSLLLPLLLAPQGPAAGAYDPLALPPAHVKAAPLDLTVDDAARARQIPLRVYLPPATAAAPVVLFSHGLGGSRQNSAYLAEHWSARGYVVVCMQHAGSDESVWRGVPLRDRMGALRDAASARNLVLRCEDVKAVLDRLEVWQREVGQRESGPLDVGQGEVPPAAAPPSRAATAPPRALAGRLDLARVGMSGHSFGAVTTQAVGGQANARGRQEHTDLRIDAALALSPSPPMLGRPEAAFGKVAIPWCMMTGTNDTAVIADIDAAARLRVFPALPATVDRYELVLHEAEHSAFADRALPGDQKRRNPNHHRAILAVSTAFWDCHLRADAAARAWLHGDGARSVIEAEDRWQAAAAAARAVVR